MTAANDPGPPDHPEEEEKDLIVIPPAPNTASDDDWDESDDDDDVGRNGVDSADGYQLLPQDFPHDQQPAGNNDDDSEHYSINDDDNLDISTFNIGAGANTLSLETEAQRNFQTEEIRERADIFSKSESGREIELGNEKISAIQLAMSKISLPPSSIPVWADKMPDEQWNRLIRDRLGTEAQSKSEKQENPERDVSDQVLTTD